jgi:GNAT superfamily N-acetyltransferase
VKPTYGYGSCVAHLWGPEYLEGLTNTWLISALRTFPNDRRKGYATKVMEEICKDADAEGVTLYVEAAAETNDNPKNPGLTQVQLEAFYRRFGFRPFLKDNRTALRR